MKRVPLSPPSAAALSLLPGLGHWYAGKSRKAAALFVYDAGIVFTLLFLKSNVGRLLAGFSYFLVMVPAVLETYALAAGERGRLGESKPYIIMLLIFKGFWALPLLWQSCSFSKRSKILWSVAVPVFAALYFTFLGFYGVRLYYYLQSRMG